MTVTNGGDTIIAAMEGALSGDTDATLHRFLTYNKDRRGHWALVKQRHHTPALDWQRRRGFRMTR